MVVYFDSCDVVISNKIGPLSQLKQEHIESGLPAFGEPAPDMSVKLAYAP